MKQSKYKDRFIELVERYQRSQSIKVDSEFNMLIAFISLMDDFHFDCEIEDLLNQKSLENGLKVLHESMLQYDFFDRGQGSILLDSLFYNFWVISVVPAMMFKLFIEELKNGVK